MQWKRKELKRHSRAVLRSYYWRIVFVTFVLTFLFGSDSTVSKTVKVIREDFESEADSAIKRLTELFNRGALPIVDGIAFPGVVMLAGVVFSVLLAIGAILLSIFIVNPLAVGASRFYLHSFEERPQFKELFYAFENHYNNVVTVMLLKDIFTILWSLLLLIPGIIKAYEYRMVSYLLAENPALESAKAFALSRQMMYGQKWKAFVLDLSFLGWEILSTMTMGILGIFYVDPYVQLSHAALYRKLSGKDRTPENIYYDGMEHDTGGGMTGWGIKY